MRHLLIENTVHLTRVPPMKKDVMRMPMPFPGEYPTRLRVGITGTTEKDAYIYRYIGKPSRNVHDAAVKFMRVASRGEGVWSEFDRGGCFAMGRFEWGVEFTKYPWDTIRSWEPHIFAFYHPFMNNTIQFFTRWTLPLVPTGFAIGKQKWVAYVSKQKQPTTNMLLGYKNSIPKLWLRGDILKKIDPMRLRTNQKIVHDLSLLHKEKSRLCPRCGSTNVAPHAVFAGAKTCRECAYSWSG